MDNYLFDIDKSTAIYGAWPWLRTFRTHPMMFASLIGHVSQAPFGFVIGPVGIVAAWVTLLYAVGPALNWHAAGMGQMEWRASLWGALEAQQTFTASSRPSSTQGTFPSELLCWLVYLMPSPPQSPSGNRCH